MKRFNNSYLYNCFIGSYLLKQMFEASSFSFVLSFSICSNVFVFHRIFLAFSTIEKHFPQFSFCFLLFAIEYRIYLFFYIYRFSLNYFFLVLLIKHLIWCHSLRNFLQEWCLYSSVCFTVYLQNFNIFSKLTKS